jgi:hypothetical protein
MWSDIETSKDILSFSVHLNKAEREMLQLLLKHGIYKTISSYFSFFL